MDHKIQLKDLWDAIDNEQEQESALLVVKLSRQLGTRHPELVRAMNFMDFLFWGNDTEAKPIKSRPLKSITVDILTGYGCSDSHDTYEEAESARDWIEVVHDRGGISIMEWDDKYYLYNND